ncbi:SDR family NAD(P)-dependent oxidoreductase [Pedobacter suwonensis]|uniref:SDR family NAD(P)-dependent oxidoreductase n=1 Tax=Pedobacter suwonensis TaxID=332999 RepID=UPI003C2D02BE
MSRFTDGHPVTVALVTGGGSGIGLALARRLLVRNGVTMVIAGRDEQRLLTAVKELRGVSSRVSHAVLDVRDPEAFHDVCTRVQREHGSLDLLVNNAGVAVAGSVAELGLAHWQRSIETNLCGAVHGVLAAYPLMAAQGRGHIINVSSLAGIIHAPLMGPYTVAKAGVTSLTMVLRAEGARHGVRATAVCPSLVETSMLERVNNALPATWMNGHTKEQVSRLGLGIVTADSLARRVLRAVDRDRAVVVASFRDRVAWSLERHLPAVSARVRSRYVRGYPDSSAPGPDTVKTP